MSAVTENQAEFPAENYLASSLLAQRYKVSPLSRAHLSNLEVLKSSRSTSEVNFTSNSSHFIAIARGLRPSHRPIHLCTSVTGLV